MVLMRIVLVGVAIVVLMAVAQDQRWPQRTGVIGICSATAPPQSDSDGYWYSCKEGVVNGFPNLEADHCLRAGVAQRREYWQCDVVLDSLPGA